MGQRQVKIETEELEELTIVSGFTREELYRLNIAFQDLDTDHRGVITVKQFMQFPQLEYNPFLKRIIDISGLRMATAITFRQFVQTLSVLSENAPKDAKLRFAFRLYDVDGDNFVSQKDMEHILSLVVGEQLGEEHVRDIAKRSLEELDVDGDGKLNFNEFGKAIQRRDLKRVHELIEQNIGLDDVDPDGRTALHVACAWGYTEAAEMLLEHGASVTARTAKGNTPLHLAAISGEAACVRVVLEFGGDPKALDGQGRTPMDLAVRLGHEGVQRALSQSMGISWTRPVMYGPGQREIGGCKCKHAH